MNQQVTLGHVRCTFHMKRRGLALRISFQISNSPLWPQLLGHALVPFLLLTGLGTLLLEEAFTLSDHRRVLFAMITTTRPIRSLGVLPPRVGRSLIRRCLVAGML